MIYKLLNNAKKALVIGAGSGRDIFSSILIVERLISLGLEVDLAGFLTPWALHLFDGKIEKPINYLKNKSLEKFLPYKKRIFINEKFIEQHLLDFNEEFNLKINKIWLFSLFYGTNKLKNEIEQMINREGYNIIIAVDVGGDILAKESDFQFLKTPIVDLSCLTILKEIKTQAKKILTIISPSSCGELPTHSILNHINHFSFLYEEQIFDFDTEKFIDINEKLNYISNNYSGTFNTIKSIIQQNDLIKEKIKIINLNNKEYKIPIKLNLDPVLLKKVIWFDLIKYSSDSPYFNYNNLFQAVEILLNKKVFDLELSFSCLTNNFGESSISFPIYLILFNKNIQDAIKQDMFNQTLNLLTKDEIAGILICKNDFIEGQIPQNLSKYYRENLKIVYKHSSLVNEQAFNNLFNYSRRES